MKKILIIIILIILLAVGGFVAYKIISAPRVIELKPFTYDPGDYFVTDVKGGGALLKTDIMIDVSDDRLAAELTAENYKIRNDIIFILRSMSAEELRADGIENTLSEVITTKLNAEFETESFTKVYFNEFVVQ